MLHTKFRGNRMPGSGEEVFEGYYHIWAWRPSWSCDQHHVNKIFLYLKAFIQNLVQNGSAVSEKIRFQEMTLTFNYHKPS